MNELSKTKLNRITVCEEEFVNSLKEFINGFITPLCLRDTVFKRSVLDDPSVATSLNSIIDIHAACSGFLHSIKESSTSAEIASAYSQYAPSLVLFSQYISESATAITNLGKFGKPLSDLFAEKMPTGVTLEMSLALPEKHYMQYRENFTNFVQSFPDDSPDRSALNAALEIWNENCDLVDKKVQEESSKLELLMLQQSCKYS